MWTLSCCSGPRRAPRSFSSGLRRAEGKAVLTVLGFIGQQRREFRFDLRYQALTDYDRKETGEGRRG